MTQIYRGVEISIALDEQATILTVTAKLTPAPGAIRTLMMMTAPSARAETEAEVLEWAKHIIDKHAS